MGKITTTIIIITVKKLLAVKKMLFIDMTDLLLCKHKKP